MVYEIPTIQPVKRSDYLRFVKDLGLYVLDRGLDSCTHKTSFCSKKCYNNKFNMYPNFVACQAKNSEKYESCPAAIFNGLTRVRLCSRGEPIRDHKDIDRIERWAFDNPLTLFKAPTRGWRDVNHSGLRQKIEDRLFRVPNLRLMASVDPSNKIETIQSLIESGWSTIFFGNDEVHPLEHAVKCIKTWNHTPNACAVCKGGCFKLGQKHVWLKKH